MADDIGSAAWWEIYNSCGTCPDCIYQKKILDARKGA